MVHTVRENCLISLQELGNLILFRRWWDVRKCVLVLCILSSNSPFPIVNCLNKHKYLRAYKNYVMFYNSSEKLSDTTKSEKIAFAEVTQIHFCPPPTFKIIWRHCVSVHHCNIYYITNQKWLKSSCWIYVQGWWKPWIQLRAVYTSHDRTSYRGNPARHTHTPLCQHYGSIGTQPAPSGISSVSDTGIIQVGLVCTHT